MVEPAQIFKGLEFVLVLGPRKSKMRLFTDSDQVRHAALAVEVAFTQLRCRCLCNPKPYISVNMLRTQPITAGVQEVAPQCAFASSGLTISDDGFISGTVTVKNRSTIKCSIVSVQDPVRGLMTNLDFSLPVSEFSYGDQVIYFKFWGLNHGFGGFKDVQGNVLV